MSLQNVLSCIFEFPDCITTVSAPLHWKGPCTYMREEVLFHWWWWKELQHGLLAGRPSCSRAIITHSHSAHAIAQRDNTTLHSYRYKKSYGWGGHVLCCPPLTWGGEVCFKTTSSWKVSIFKVDHNTDIATKSFEHSRDAFRRIILQFAQPLNSVHWNRSKT